MSTNELSDILRQFIARHIGSVRELEVLLMLAENPREWSAEEVGAKTYVAPSAAERILDGLVDSALLVRTQGEPPTYRYQPGALDSSVRELADKYRYMRPRIVDLIYGGPNDDLESFSDAFRLRKGKD